MKTVSIQDRQVSYQIVFRKIRYARLEFKGSALFLILPRRYSEGEKLLAKHAKWIYNTASKIEELEKQSKNLLPNLQADEQEFREKTVKIICEFAEELNVTVSKITFRKMKSRWGSCRTDGRISINTVLRLLPERFIRYILFHEVAHLIEQKHNKRFKQVIAGKFTDMNEIEKQLPAWGKVFTENSL